MARGKYLSLDEAREKASRRRGGAWHQESATPKPAASARP